MTQPTILTARQRRTLGPEVDALRDGVHHLKQQAQALLNRDELFDLSIWEKTTPNPFEQMRYQYNHTVLALLLDGLARALGDLEACQRALSPAPPIPRRLAKTREGY